MPPWPSAASLHSSRVRLTAVREGDAAEAAVVFDDPRLHIHTGGTPAGVDELRARFRRQSRGISPDGTEGWLTWHVRLGATDEIVGMVQATLSADSAGGTVATLAWVVATPHQRRGYAVEAMRTVVAWLASLGIVELRALIAPLNEPSAGVARALGMRESTQVVDDEKMWTTA